MAVILYVVLFSRESAADISKTAGNTMFESANSPALVISFFMTVETSRYRSCAILPDRQEEFSNTRGIISFTSRMSNRFFIIFYVFFRNLFPSVVRVDA